MLLHESICRLLGDGPLGIHAAVPLHKILLTTKDGQGHEELTKECRKRCNTNCWIQVKTVGQRDW